MIETPREIVIFALFNGYKIQLERRKRGKYKDLTIVPGGGVDENESPEEAVVREPIEEYGVKPTRYEKLGVLTTPNGNNNHVYIITEWEGQISNPEEKSEHLEETLNDAYMRCDHPLSKQVLDLITSKVLKGD